MTRRARAWCMTVLALALIVLALALVACGPVAVGANKYQSIAISTPNPASLTPTPTFPPFTVGAWPSNFSPHNADTITIYVLCRVQPSAMTTASTPPPPGLPVTVQVASPINQQDTGATDADGLAAIPVTFTDPQSGTPVVVNVIVTYNGQTYVAQTFFTPNPTTAPTPTPKPSPSAAASTGPGTPTAAATP